MPDHSPDYPIKWSDDGIRTTGSEEVRARWCFIHTQTITLMWSDYDAAVSWHQNNCVFRQESTYDLGSLPDEDRGSC